MKIDFTTEEEQFCVRIFFFGGGGGCRAYFTFILVAPRKPAFVNVS